MPPSSKPKESLTERQKTILTVINDAIAENGYPPSIREIGDAVGLQSTSSVAYQLQALEKKGYLIRDAHKPRAVDVRSPNSSSRQPSRRAQLPRGASQPAFVPVVGRIAAGGPILAEQEIEAVFPLPEELVGSGETFILKVVGESMRDAGILDGDYVCVRRQQVAENGDIVAAMIDGEATVKTLDKSSSGVWLVPANEAFRPIPGDYATILGRVIMVFRRL
ncbi:transcriptional repressor LexA [Dietzia sp.]|uniref:transcriptional repressor LexA n=1 Tax=Dietzia sp. TaxID=1871616 RepID=UPI002FD90CDD